MIDDMREAAAGVARAAANIGAAGNPVEVPRSTRPDLERFGALVREIAETVDPKKGYDAVESLQAVSLDLGLGAGGRAEGPGRVAVGSSVILGMTPKAAAEARRNLESAPTHQEAKEHFKSDLDSYFTYLPYVALITNPGARTAFAPRSSPTDLPPELPRDLAGGVEGMLENAGIDTVEEWGRLLFDGQGRLLIPDPGADPRRWDSFFVWAGHINPDLATAADAMRSVINEAYMSSQVSRPS